MDEKIIISYVIIALLTVGSLVAMAMKFIQPINELRIAIQKLTDTIDNLIKENEALKSRITEHGKEIDTLTVRVNAIETKMKFFHKE